MSSNGNANYTHIQAHGIAGAFEPGFISQAATVGLPHGPVSVGSPYKVLDVTVDLTGAGTGLPIFIIGEEIPVGCVITGVTFNGQNTLPVGTVVEFGLAEPVVAPLIGPTTFVATAPFVSAAAVAVPVPPASVGLEPNTGQAVVGVVSVPVAAGVAGAPQYPAIILNPAIPNPLVLPASVSVKVVYFCP